jgi:hypothetical protein
VCLFYLPKAEELVVETQAVERGHGQAVPLCGSEHVRGVMVYGMNGVRESGLVNVCSLRACI